MVIHGCPLGLLLPGLLHPGYPDLGHSTLSLFPGCVNVPIGAASPRHFPAANRFSVIDTMSHYDASTPIGAIITRLIQYCGILISQY